MLQLVYVSGNIKVIGNEYYIVSIVHPVSPSIMEMRMEANMFVTHYNMELKCIFFDGRYIINMSLCSGVCVSL